VANTVRAASVVGFLERRHGVRFDAVAPFNEPLEGGGRPRAIRNTLLKGVDSGAPEINAILPSSGKRWARNGGLRSGFVGACHGSGVNRPGRKNQLSMRSIRTLSRLNIHGV